MLQIKRKMEGFSSFLILSLSLQGSYLRELFLNLTMEGDLFMPCSRKMLEITCFILLTRTQGLCGQYVVPVEKGRPQVKKKKGQPAWASDSKVSLPVLPAKPASPLVSLGDTRGPWIGWMRWCPLSICDFDRQTAQCEARLVSGLAERPQRGRAAISLLWNRPTATGGTGAWWITRFRRLANPRCQVFHVGRWCVRWHREMKA